MKRSRNMQISLIIFTFILATITQVFCGRLNELHHSIKNECPSQEDIPKCRCEIIIGGLSINCKGFYTNSDFESHLKSLQGYSLKKLEINHYNASSVSTDLWKGQDIEHLSLNYIEVDDASFRRGNRHFQGLENSLDTLEVAKSFTNGHRPLLNLQLDHLNKLKHAIFEHNNIPEVGNDWFTSGPKELSTLIFEKNGIEELGDEAFASLNNLKTLAVAGNHLNSISRSMLPKSATLLLSLDLAYNKIRNLPNDIFSGMPSLQDVNLDYNLIHLIQEDTWSPVASQIISLSLQGNLLQCDEKMKWMCKTSLRSAHGKCSLPIEKKGSTLHQFCN